MPPPPVNWRTKPKPRQQHPQEDSSLLTSQHSSTATNSLVPLYIDPARLRDIEAALRFLGLPPLSNDGNNYTQDTLHQDNANHPTPPQFEHLDNCPVSQSGYYPDVSPIGRYSPAESSNISDLSASFSRLSTSTSSVQVSSGSFPVHRSPAIQPNSLPRKNLKRYYVVTIGKCTSVFWEEWDDVSPLVNRVSGACYHGFSTRAQATAFYLDAKSKGLVRIVRDPGDDALFGPLCDAMQ